MTTQFQITAPVEHALGKVGFPRQVLFAVFDPKDSARVLDQLRHQGISAKRFTRKDNFNPAVRPAVFGHLMELLFNEGVLIRELRRQLDYGRHLIAIAVAPEELQELSDSLFRSGSLLNRYFDTYQTKILAPPSLED